MHPPRSVVWRGRQSRMAFHSNVAVSPLEQHPLSSYWKTAESHPLVSGNSGTRGKISYRATRKRQSMSRFWRRLCSALTSQRGHETVGQKSTSASSVVLCLFSISFPPRGFFARNFQTCSPFRGGEDKSDVVPKRSRQRKNRSSIGEKEGKNEENTDKEEMK